MSDPNIVSQTVEASGGIATLGINLKIFIAQLINFVVVLLVLWKFAYAPIIKMLDARSKKIEESMKNAADIEKRVRELEVEQKEVIAKAKSEAAHILETAQADAESRKQELVAATKKEVEQIVARGKEQLNAEKENMVRDARAEIVTIAVSATKKILEETVDEKKSSALAEAVVKKMTA